MTNTNACVRPPPGKKITTSDSFSGQHHYNSAMSDIFMCCISTT